MYIVKTESGQVLYAGEGRLAGPPAAGAVVYREETLADYYARVAAALPNWRGSFRDVIVDETGAPLRLKPQPTPRAAINAADRQTAALRLRIEVEASPVCRALWEGADLSAWPAEIVADAAHKLLRYALLAGSAPAPNWTLESRYDV
ncbi:MAG: hypothetical protein JXB47_13660 [Anaerolineae bacterium]|nr:hypothetical protein [Anaerolineae bacterium]